MTRHGAMALLGAWLLASCSVLRVDSASHPARIESAGLIESHLALGIPSELHLLHAQLGDGTSPGALAELTLWKLLHVEIGAAGLALGVGPLHLGLGIVFYEPRIPDMMQLWTGSGSTRRESADADDELPVPSDGPDGPRAAGQAPAGLRS